MRCKKCEKPCEHFLTDFREYAGDPQPKKVEACVFHLIYQELCNLNRRMAMVHQEVGQAKNASIMQSLVILGDETGRSELERVIKREIPRKDALRALSDS